MKRTKVAFSRSAVDQTLEQTVNADAASRLTGISAFTTSEEARHRWMVAHSARSSIIGHLLELAGMSMKQDSTYELGSSKITRDKCRTMRRSWRIVVNSSYPPSHVPAQ